MAIMSQLPPPVPFSDFVFDEPMFSNNLPSSDLSLPDPDFSLLSNSESNSFFGFLENFEWEFDPVLPVELPAFPPSYDLNIPLLPESPPSVPSHQNVQHSRSSSKSSPSSAASPPHLNHTSTRSKVLLSTPQKRLNHIMSEQKRRNAIREGYATLSNMLAPAGAPVGSGLPTRGRPKGSGSRGKATSAKGKSGVLFRAVEYCKWLEDSCEALRREVERIELAAGIDGNVNL